MDHLEVFDQFSYNTLIETHWEFIYNVCIIESSARSGSGTGTRIHSGPENLKKSRAKNS